MAVFGRTPPTTLEEAAAQQAAMFYRPGSADYERYYENVLLELTEVDTKVTVEGVGRFLVPNIAYHIPKRLELPDGRQAELTGGWLESMPPQGSAILVEDELFNHTDVYKAVPM